VASFVEARQPAKGASVRIGAAGGAVGVPGGAGAWDVVVSGSVVDEVLLVVVMGAAW